MKPVILCTNINALSFIVLRLMYGLCISIDTTISCTNLETMI